MPRPKPFVTYERPAAGGPKPKPRPSTPVTTLAVGEEAGAPVTTLAVGEEAGSPTPR